MAFLRSFLSVFFLIYGVCCSHFLIAQGVMEGRVVDDNGDVVPFASVAVVDSLRNIGSTANAEGRYNIYLPTADSFDIRLSAVGFMPRIYKVALRGGERRRFDCILPREAKQLNEVVVSDQKSRTSGFTNISIDKLQDAVGPSSGVESILKTLPDVNSNNEMSSQYSVRGGSFDENLVYINNVEVYRPMLVRSGQQEGMSIINPDMVDHILFSPGGFDATSGDKMSSVLDIIYSRPSHFAASASASLLGAAAHVEGLLGSRATYSFGFRRHSNAYIFNSLDTKGAYTTHYTDLQAVLSYRISENLDLSLLGIWSHNVYGLVPESQTTTFGSFLESLELDVYFDGKEEDKYTTLLGAATLHWHPSDIFQLRWITSLQANDEQEHYDIQSQFWLYELGLGSSSEVERFDRGVGTFLEHARNLLHTKIFATEIRGTLVARLGNWNWGAKLQYESVDDHIREWKWVDSAGYAMPRAYDTPGDTFAVPSSPQLQFFSHAVNAVKTIRMPLFLQRDASFTTNKGTDIKALLGIRAHYYNMDFGASCGDRTAQALFFSPRLNVSIQPEWEHDMLFRTAAGIYRQAPFYREYRRLDGSLNPDIGVQTSYQLMETFDWNFHMLNRRFRLTADVYYKYITDLIPYTIDNLRVRYDALNNAIGYATGLSLRLNGEFVEGLESWASISLMQTQENIENDGLGWIARPTDQRFSVKMFLQDYIPSFPWWRMSINFIYGTGLPVTFPYQRDRSVEHRLPPYFRVDWGNTVQLNRIEKCSKWRVFRYVKDIEIGVDVFNLFNYRNVVSYIWVADYENTYYPVPNYLTARQLNIKATVLF